MKLKIIHETVDPDAFLEKGGKHTFIYANGRLFLQPGTVRHEEMMRNQAVARAIFPNGVDLEDPELPGIFNRFGLRWEEDPKRRAPGYVKYAIRLLAELRSSTGRTGILDGQLVVALWSNNQYVCDALQALAARPETGVCDETPVVVRGKSIGKVAELLNIRRERESRPLDQEPQDDVPEPMRVTPPQGRPVRKYWGESRLSSLRS